MSESEYIGFNKLERRIYRFYLEKGYSKERAREIARATAGKIFWRKYGKETGSEILKMARRARRE